MPTYPFDETIPAAPNNPSADQPLMLQNNASINSILNEDHFTFEQANNDGYHRQTRMIAGALPAPRPASGGTTYVKNVQTLAVPATNEGSAFFTPDAAGKEYQLTRTIDSKFGTFANVSGAGNSGWTFLAGGLLMQWGRPAIAVMNETPVVFPVTYSTVVMSVLLTGERQNTGGDNIFIKTASIGLGGFTIFNNSGSIKDCCWLAIGK